MRTSNLYFNRLVTVALVTAILAFLPAALQAGGKPVVQVSGGGTATFDDVQGLASQFAVGAVKHADGSVNGHFTCVIPGFVTISGDVQTVVENGDNVTLTGVAHGIDFASGQPVVFWDCAYNVTLWEGGPGEGRFVYDDCVLEVVVA